MHLAVTVKKKMSNGFFREVCLILSIIVDFLLKPVYFVFDVVIYVSGLLLHRLFYSNMIETSKKRKRNNNEQPNPTVANRGLIDANWQKFLASNLLMATKTETPIQKDQKDQYTGTFRRARRKKPKSENGSNFVQNGLQTLQINSSDVSPSNNTNSDTRTSSKTLKSGPNNVTNNSKPNQKKNQLTRFIAMDCEMVGIGYNGDDHMLARVSLVNKFGDCIYDKFVKPREDVVDYRTSISGVRKEDLLNGDEFSKVQKEVSEILKGRVLVGHSLKNDLSVLFLSHPKRSIRDTARYKPFRKITKGSTPSLKRLAKEILNIDIQTGEHSSVEDAKAAMQLYCTVGKKWEAGLSEKRGHSRRHMDE